ncbi:MAG: DUF3597 domain-containing protein [Proteobacteria bacterium]|nr:MAG: DUF3597 domain-containing protein [Pseudomonadota bacterium]
MSIFGKILSKIFPSNHPAVTPTSSAPPAAAKPAATPTATPAAASPQVAPATPAAAMPPVDVEAVLTGLSAKNPGPANWRTSIVDLLKLLELDSDLNSRKELAKELNYTGDTSDSATMNIWLHKQVMAKLAANGGKVPADLKD